MNIFAVCLCRGNSIEYSYIHFLFQHNVQVSSRLISVKSFDLKHSEMYIYFHFPPLWFNNT